MTRRAITLFVLIAAMLGVIGGNSIAATDKVPDTSLGLPLQTISADGSQPEDITQRYWTGELQQQVVVDTPDGQHIMPGPDELVNWIVTLEGASVFAHRGELEREERFSAETLQSYADQLKREQQLTIETLQKDGLLQTVNHQYTDLVNAIAVTARQSDYEAIAKTRSVVSVTPDFQKELTLNESVPLVGAPAVWQQIDLNGTPLRGAGTTIAIIDSGIDYTHPDLGGCLGTGCRVVGGYDYIDDDNDPMDTNGHGTHVAGIAAANGSLVGVAPEAELLALRVCEFYCESSDIIAAIEYAANPDGNPATDDGVDVINLSLGGPGDRNDPVALAADQAVAAGVVVVAAAGNNYDYGSVGSPGTAPNVITVGSTDKQDVLSEFSSKGGLNLDFTLKPEIVAPGDSIQSTLPGNSTGYNGGTSMAAPHVAGAAALLRQANPMHAPPMIKAMLVNHAAPLAGNPLAVGNGRLQVDEALDAVFIVEEAVLNVGLVDLSQPIWETEYSLTVRNLSDTPRTISVDSIVDPSVAGFTLQFDTSSLMLPAGGIGTVSVHVRVDNSLPPLTEEPYALYGHVQFTEGDTTVTVPVVVTRAATMQVVFEGGMFGSYLLHNRETDGIFINSLFGPQLHIVPAGVYDFVFYRSVAYDGLLMETVVKEGIDVTMGTTIAVSPADLLYTVETAGVDVGGTQFPISTYTGNRLHYPTIGAVFSFGFSGFVEDNTLWSTSGFSDSYHMQRCSFAPDANDPTVYYDFCFENQGLDGSQQMMVDSAETRPITWNLPPIADDTDSFILKPIYADNITFDGSGGYSPFERMPFEPEVTVYHSPISDFPHAGQYRAMIYVPMKGIDKYTAEERASMLSPMIDVQPDSTDYYYYDYDDGWFVEERSADLDTWSFALSPVRFNGHLDVGSDYVQVLGNVFDFMAGVSTDSQHNRIHGSMLFPTYQLTTPTEEWNGVLDHAPYFHLQQPGAVELTITTPLLPTEPQGQTTTRITFDTMRSDAAPPYLRDFSVLDAEGRPTDHIVGSGTVRVAAADDQSGISAVDVWLDWRDGLGYRALATTLIDGFYVADLTVPAAGSGIAALTVSVEDMSGNYLTSETDRAFTFERADGWAHSTMLPIVRR